MMKCQIDGCLNKSKTKVEIKHYIVPDALFYKVELNMCAHCFYSVTQMAEKLEDQKIKCDVTTIPIKEVPTCVEPPSIRLQEHSEWNRGWKQAGTK